MNPAALNRLDRKSLLSLAQKHKIPRPAALSKEQLVQKLTVKCEVQPSVKRQTTKKVPPKPQIATFVDKKPVLGTSKPKSPLILPTKKNWLRSWRQKWQDSKASCPDCSSNRGD